METPERKSFLTFINKPINAFVVITSIVAGLFVIPETIDYFYPVNDHELRYTTTSPLLLANTVPDVPVELVWGKENINNLFSSRIILWNSGKGYIDKNQINETAPLYIEHSPDITIIKSSINPMPRQNLGITFAIEKNNKISINFNKNDALSQFEGAIIEVYYTGSINPDFNLKGIIKGASDNPEKMEIKRKPDITFFAIVHAIALAIFMIFILYLVYLDIKEIYITLFVGEMIYMKEYNLKISISYKDIFYKALNITMLILFILSILFIFLSYFGDLAEVKVYVPDWVIENI